MAGLVGLGSRIACLSLLPAWPPAQSAARLLTSSAVAAVEAIERDGEEEANIQKMEAEALAAMQAARVDGGGAAGPSASGSGGAAAPAAAAGAQQQAAGGGAAGAAGSAATKVQLSAQEADDLFDDDDDDDDEGLLAELEEGLETKAALA